MYIDNYTRKIQLVLTAAKTANDLTFMATYDDQTNPIFAPITNVGSTNGTTAVDIIPLPDKGSIHRVSEILVYNNDTAAKTIQLLFNDNGTTYRFLDITLQVDDSLNYTAGSGWTVMDLNGNVKSTSTIAGIISTSPSTGIGYGTGAGGTVTQITNRSTGVTLNTVCGSIQTDTTSLAAGASAEFTVTNSRVAIGDVVVVSQRSGSSTVAGVAGTSIIEVVTVAAGSFILSVNNNSSTTAETGAIIINFAIIKAVTA